ELADMVELAAAGAIAFSDDGSPVEDSHLFRSALEYARVTGRPVIEHAQDLALSAKGVMHEGSVSARLGLPGMPAAAEESAVARDIALARMTGANLHLTHLSTAGSIELVRRAKADGVPVTCDVTPHHLALGGVGVHWAALGTVSDALTIGPARVLGIEAPRGDWTVIDRDAEWVVRADELASKGKNTPLIGRTLTGRVVATVVGGELRYEGEARVAEAVSGR